MMKRPSAMATTLQDHDECLFLDSEMFETDFNEKKFSPLPFRPTVFCGIPKVARRSSGVYDLFESIPDDVWRIIFPLLADGRDISLVFPLKLVRKRWANIFPDSFSEITIFQKKSLNSLLSLRTVRSLSIYCDCNITEQIFATAFPKLTSLSIFSEDVITEVSNEMWSQMSNLKLLDISHAVFPNTHFIFNNINLPLFINLEILKLSSSSSSIFRYSALKQLVNLKQLDLNKESIYLKEREFNEKYGQNLQILDDLKDLKIITLQRYKYLNIHEIQNKYPHVRFRWHADNAGYYEGPFSEKNEYEGRGVFNFEKSGCRYEGDFKNDKREGKGVFISLNGERYEGEFKNGKRDGKGFTFHPIEGRFEGEFKENKKVGVGIQIFPDGGRCEVTFENDRMISHKFIS